MRQVAVRGAWTEAEAQIFVWRLGIKFAILVVIVIAALLYAAFR